MFRDGVVIEHILIIILSLLCLLGTYVGWRTGVSQGREDKSAEIRHQARKTRRANYRYRLR